jgi:hypothetical protein
MAFDMSWDVCTGSGGTCDWRGKSKAAHAEHVADVLASLPGIAITQLPEPTDEDRTDWDSPGRGVWINPMTGFVRFQTNQFDSAEARALAAALLAAAAEADHA